MRNKFYSSILHVLSNVEYWWFNNYPQKLHNLGSQAYDVPSSLSMQVEWWVSAMVYIMSTSDRKFVEAWWGLPSSESTSGRESMSTGSSVMSKSGVDADESDTLVNALGKPVLWNSVSQLEDNGGAVCSGGWRALLCCSSRSSPRWVLELPVVEA